MLMSVCHILGCVSVSMGAGGVIGKGGTGIALPNLAWQMALVTSASVCCWHGVVRTGLGDDGHQAGIVAPLVWHPNRIGC